VSARFDTVTIVGVGLLGGSLGLALKQRGLARRVLGVGRRPETMNTALQRGVIDQAFAVSVEAVPESDLIVLCTPAANVIGYLDAIRPLCRKGAVVTDVASTKRDICAHVRKAWSEPFRFIGSHPMAGSEKFGPEHASAKLFENSVCFVEAMNSHAPDAHAAVSEMWTAVGAQVVPIEPAAHDVLAARTSHVPHIVASALARLTARDGDALRAFVGGGFRDTTRIAEGRPELWRDISLTNADAILGVLRELQADLSGFSEALTKNDAEILEKFFTEGRDARRRMLDT
jgi:prephenate dehydrogenase